MRLSQIIKRPVISEKSLILASQGKYTFEVDPQASKNLVKEAVEKFFKVKVVKVWLVKIKGKKRLVGRFRRKVKQYSDWKKAIVQVTQGQKIELFEKAVK